MWFGMLIRKSSRITKHESMMMGLGGLHVYDAFTREFDTSCFSCHRSGNVRAIIAKGMHDGLCITAVVRRSAFALQSYYVDVTLNENTAGI
jgi:inosine-uridine nucleoside N-ribohydrolase